MLYLQKHIKHIKVQALSTVLFESLRKEDMRFPIVKKEESSEIRFNLIDHVSNAENGSFQGITTVNTSKNVKSISSDNWLSLNEIKERYGLNAQTINNRMRVLSEYLPEGCYKVIPDKYDGRKRSYYYTEDAVKILANPYSLVPSGWKTINEIATELKISWEQIPFRYRKFSKKYGDTHKLKLLRKDYYSPKFIEELTIEFDSNKFNISKNWLTLSSLALMFNCPRKVLLPDIKEAIVKYGIRSERINSGNAMMFYEPRILDALQEKIFNASASSEYRKKYYLLTHDELIKTIKLDNENKKAIEEILSDYNGIHKRSVAINESVTLQVYNPKILLIINSTLLTRSYANTSEKNIEHISNTLGTVIYLSMCYMDLIKKSYFNKGNFLSSTMKNVLKNSIFEPAKQIKLSHENIELNFQSLLKLKDDNKDPVMANMIKGLTSIFLHSTKSGMAKLAKEETLFNIGLSYLKINVSDWTLGDYIFMNMLADTLSKEHGAFVDKYINEYEDINIL